MNKKVWWAEGLKFECQGSGKCCTSHGEFGFVFLTRADRKLMAQHLGLTTRQFVSQYCEKTSGQWHLIERKDNPDCLFLKKKRCGVYEARPIQCRTWPFWPEVMSPKAWKKEVARFCPGVDQGRLWSAEEIQIQLDLQTRAEKQMLSENSKK